MTQTSDPTREITLERDFKTPLDLVWRAWTEKEMLEKWWGPNIFQTEVTALEVRVGGAFDLIMHGPDKVEYPMKSIYTVVDPKTNLAFAFDAWHQGSIKALSGVNSVTLTTTEEGTKVIVNAKATGHVPEAEFMLAGMEQGWSETLNRLGNLVVPA